MPSQRGEEMAVHSLHPARKAFALLGRRVSDARLAEIAEPLGIAVRSVSSMVRAAEALEARDPTFQRRLRETQDRLLRPNPEINHHSET